MKKVITDKGITVILWASLTNITDKVITDKVITDKVITDKAWPPPARHSGTIRRD